MAVIGHGADLCTSATRPATPSIGSIIYQTDTDEHLKYVTDLDGQNRWMQADHDSNCNLVINGGFNIWQRGTSFNPTSVNTLSGNNYGADRWQFLQATTSAAAFTQQANTPSGPAGYNFYTRVQRVAAATLVTPYILQTSFESQNLRNVRGKFVTLSFWARAGANYSASSSELSVQVAGGVGTDNTYDNFSTPFGVASSAFTLTTGWKRFTLTSAATLSTTTSQLGIRIAFTPVGTAGAADYFDITGVQLEVGTAPSEFEFEPFETTLRKCQRYYMRWNVLVDAGRLAIGSATSATAAYFGLVYRVAPRTHLGTLDTGGALACSDGQTGTAVSSLARQDVTCSDAHYFVAANTAGSLTAFRPYWLESTASSTTSYVASNMEL
jgi:hypothetical protein